MLSLKESILTLLLILTIPTAIANQEITEANNKSLHYYKNENIKEAINWALIGAKQGDAEAQFRLGRAYAYYGRGIKSNPIEAMKMYQLSANQGYGDAEHAIGNLYVFGNREFNTKVDYDTAAKWFKRAADNGSSSGQLSLGFLYRNGWGMPRDYKKALELFKQSANKNNHDAQSILGKMHRKGEGVKKDTLKAIYWYKKAFKNGNVFAAFTISEIYEQGDGIPQDYNKAIKYMEMYVDVGPQDRAQGFLDKLMQRIKYSCKGELTTVLFGQSLKCAKRRDLMAAIKNAGLVTIIEDINNWADTYDSSKTLPKSKEFIIKYTFDNIFALATYVFPSSSDTNQVVEVKNLIQRKYGIPDEITGTPSNGAMTYTWQLEDGIVITVGRDWPDTTTYLSYEHPESYQKMKLELAKQKEERESREFKQVEHGI